MPAAIEKLFDRTWKIRMLLFLSSLAIFAIYYGSILLHPNSCLSSITGDSLKNYYTFVFFTKNDSWGLFSYGMNFPFGEHFVFTDCIPLLSFICKLFPFTHEYLIGILHLCLLFSMITCPLIYYNIFEHLRFPRSSGFIISLSIPLLTPQLMRIEAGHLALVFAFVIPGAILLLLKFFSHPCYRYALYLFFYNLLLFFVHPYHGLSVAIFSLLSIGLFILFDRSLLKAASSYIQAFIAGALPLILFRGFLLLTDKRTDRVENPWGSEHLISQPGSLLIPRFGPFTNTFSSMVSVQQGNFEGTCYLGMFIILFIVATLLILPFIAKRIQANKALLALFVASIVLLLISFSLHTVVIKALNLNIGALSQFRAPGRFSWFFYYIIPVVLFSTFKVFSARWKKSIIILNTIAAVYLLLNLVESHYAFKYSREALWHERNFFAFKYTNVEEKKVLESIKKTNPQAILPIPMYHTGSDAVSRGQCDASMIPSTLYSSHSGIPILANLISRTSISETTEAIELINSYKKENPARNLINENPLLVLHAKGELYPDEVRLLDYVKPFVQNDSLKIGYLSKADLLRSKITPTTVTIYEDSIYQRKNLIFIKQENHKPFTTAQFKDYEAIVRLDSNQLEPGQYVVSFRFHYPYIHYSTLGCHLIVTEQIGEPLEWIYNKGLQKQSGFYKGYGIYEDFVDIKKGAKYVFMFKGLFETGTYSISHFLIRPTNTSILIKTAKQDTIVNNFPSR